MPKKAIKKVRGETDWESVLQITCEFEKQIGNDEESALLAAREFVDEAKKEWTLFYNDDAVIVG